MEVAAMSNALHHKPCTQDTPVDCANAGSHEKERLPRAYNDTVERDHWCCIQYR
jgi:hypothetical protein